jgi:hypothetical protein
MTIRYTPEDHGTRWVIRVEDEDGGSSYMTCGEHATEADVRERIRFLLLDDDKIDGLHGEPRKYQS